MSYGMCICSMCRHEVHQNGPDHTWLHCEDQSPICFTGVARYPDKFTRVLGNPCKADEPDASEASKVLQRRRAVMPNYDQRLKDWLS